MSHRRQDDFSGEVPVAFVVRVPGATLSEDDVKDYIAKQVNHF
jgi:4-coumarate--CoA ligase